MVNDTDEIFYGIIKVYFSLKGFGFITRTKGRDIFFLRTACSDESLILEGTAVKFKVEKSDTGMRAIQILRNG